MPHLARYDIIAQLVAQLRQTWLTGFEDAWHRWPLLDDSLRFTIHTVLAKLLDTLAANALPVDLSEEALSVQLFNVAGKRGRDAAEFISLLQHTHPPTAQGGWRVGLHRSVRGNQADEAWSAAITGLVAAPNWNLILNAWSNLTPAFRSMIDTVTSTQTPLPTTLATPDGLAWIDRLACKPPPPAQDLIKSYGSLSAAEAQAIAEVLLDQHLTWRSAGLMPVIGCVQCLDYYVPDALGRIACFSGPFNPAFLQRVSSAKIRYPEAIFRQGNSFPGREQVSFLDRGLALAPVSEKQSISRPAVLAGHGELLHIKDIENPLLVLLDVDLTRDELSFLGLTGTRIRICDWASHADSLCFTKVGLDGAVELLGHGPPPNIDPHFKSSSLPLVNDRHLVSPFEGHRDAGGIGAENRIGGVPNWEQAPSIPRSPVDGRPMTFLAQFPHPNDGTAYLFLDFDNLIATVVTQWD